MLLRPEIFLLPEDIETLRPHCLVNGLVVNGYLRLIERRSCFYRNLPSVWACDSSFRSDWVRGGYEATKWRVRNIDPFSRELLLFPIHLPNVGQHGHWSLVAVWPRRAEIAAFDSLGPRSTTSRQQMECVLEFLRLHAQAKNLPFDGDGWALTTTPERLPRQTDAESCGVYVCVFADRLARNKDVSRPVDVNCSRSTIAEILKNGRFDREDFRDYQNVFVPPQSPVEVVDLLSPAKDSTATSMETEEAVKKDDEKETETCDDAAAAEDARTMGDEVSAMELDQLVGSQAPQDQGESLLLEGSAGEVGSQSSCLSLHGGDLEDDLSREPTPVASAPDSLVGVSPEQARRSHRRPESRRERSRREERRVDESRRERERRRRNRSQLDLRAVVLRRPTEHRCRPERLGTRETRRLPQLDLRHKLVAQRCERHHGAEGLESSRRSEPREPARSVRMSFTVERRFAHPERSGQGESSPRRSHRSRPVESRQRTTQASGSSSFGIPGHLRERLAELEARGWSKKDRRNKLWVMTREDGSTFKIRASKLRNLLEPR